MKLIPSLLVSLLILCDGGLTSARGILSPKAKARSEFMSIMKEVVKENGLDRNRSLKLKESLLAKATPSKPGLKGGAKKFRSLEEVEEEQEDAAEGNNYYENAAEENNYYENADEENNYYENVDEENNYDGAQNQADQVEPYYGYYQQHARNSWKRWGTNYDDAMYMDDQIDYSTYKNTPFDVSEYSLKYHSCARLSSFVDYDEKDRDENDENGQFFSNVVTNSFVTFRLCPSDTCGNDDWQGCSNMYGEYLLTMEDYGEAMQEYVEETLEQYCYFCKTCMFYDKYMYQGSDDNDHGCTYYDTCYTYKDVCNDYEDDGDDDYVGYTYSDFFQCTKVDLESDDDGDDGDDGYNEVFIGLYCNETIQLGLFSDEDCMDYIGNEQYITDITGYTIEQDMFEQENMGSSECLSCKMTDSKFFVPSMDDVDDQFDDDGHAYDILGLCENMYEKSAKCHSHLFNASSTYENENDATNADVACHFISGVQAKDVDDYGFVSSGSMELTYTDTTWEDDETDDDSIYSSAQSLYNEPISNRFDVPEYLVEYEKISLGQAMSLTVLATACAYMSIVAMCLKCSLNSLPKKVMLPNPAAVSA